jgi:hypothetical protein
MAEVRLYFWLSVAVFAVIAALGIRGRQWLLISVAGVSLAFHPWWTVPASYGMDCRFVNVEAAQVVLAVIGTIVLYQLVRVVFRHRDTG